MSRRLLYLFSFPPPPLLHPPAFPSSFFSEGNHSSDSAETHRNYCLAKLINYAKMDQAKREREGEGGRERAFFDLACRRSPCVRIFKPPLSPSVENRPQWCSIFSIYFIHLLPSSRCVRNCSIVSFLWYESSYRLDRHVYVDYRRC